MTISIEKELIGLVATELAVLGFTLFKGIVRQVAPDYSVMVGDLLEGTQRFPFVSLSVVLPEQFITGESTNVSTAVVRTVSVAMIADKAKVEIDPEPYKKYRQDAMRTINLNRFHGTLLADPGACIFHATIRPNSPIQQSSWQTYAKFVSSFDVLIQTDEPNTVT